MRDRQYPATVLEILDDEISYPDELLCVIRVFAASHPWRGSMEARKRKFSDVNRMLARACSIQEPTLVFGLLDGGSGGDSHYLPREHRIVLTGRLSVVTFLHEFGHALGFGERAACRWSINLFRKCFPRQYSRLIHVGHTLVRPQEVAKRLNASNRSSATRTTGTS